MRDDMDIEKMLKQYKSDPGPQVKQSVLSRFNGLYGSGASAREGRWWARPVPLYAFAAAICLAIGLSFFAGRATSLSRQQNTTPTGASTAAYADSLQDIEWHVAPNDLL